MQPREMEERTSETNTSPRHKTPLISPTELEVFTLISSPCVIRYGPCTWKTPKFLEPPSSPELRLRSHLHRQDTNSRSCDVNTLTHPYLLVSIFCACCSICGSLFACHNSNEASIDIGIAVIRANPENKRGNVRCWCFG